MATSIAKKFASALDTEDYRLTQSLLAEDCVYFCRGEVIHGPAAIVDSIAVMGMVRKGHSNASTTKVTFRRSTTRRTPPSA